jgi:hypothetical protein
MMLRLLGITAGVVAILVAAAVAPDIKRYLHMRSL